MSDTTDKLIAQAKAYARSSKCDFISTWHINKLVAALAREQETSRELRDFRDAFFGDLAERAEARIEKLEDELGLTGMSGELTLRDMALIGPWRARAVKAEADLGRAEAERDAIIAVLPHGFLQTADVAAEWKAEAEAQKARADRAEADAGRYRQALERIADEQGQSIHGRSFLMRETARAALGAGGDG